MKLLKGEGRLLKLVWMMVVLSMTIDILLAAKSATVTLMGIKLVARPYNLSQDKTKLSQDKFLPDTVLGTLSKCLISGKMDKQAESVSIFI